MRHRLIALALCALAMPARAKPGSDAQALFESGLREMRAGNYELGCPRLAESYRLEPLAGALFTLAECEAAWGKAATALHHYESFVKLLTVMEPARRDRFGERRSIALEKMAALNAVAPELAIAVPSELAAELVVKQNGERIEPSTYGVSKKVDPGTYELSAELAGSTVWRRRVTLSQGDHIRVEVPPASQPKRERAQAARTNEAPPLATVARPQRNVRPWIMVAAGVGAAGLAAGVTSGALAWHKKKSIDDNCADHLCNAEGHRAVTMAQRAALTSTAAFVVGAGAGAAMVALIAWSRRAARPHETPRAAPRLQPTVSLGRTPALGLEGTF